jgi:hypothetical protein
MTPPADDSAAWSASGTWLDADNPGSGLATTISGCVSVTDFTVRAGWIAGLALLALLCVGWRKTARATPRIARGSRSGARAGTAVTQLPAPSYRRTAIWRRAWALLSASFLSLLTGAVIAVVVAFAISWSVTTLSDLLRK